MKSPPSTPVAQTVRIREGFRVQTSPQILYAELERIRNNSDGKLQPRDIVREASSPLAALHSEFEWDDAVAADKQRTAHASYLVRSIEYLSPTSTPVRAYESYDLVRTGPTTTAKVYTRTEDILADPMARENLLARALKELESFKRRYAGLTELAHIFNAIKKKRKKKA